MFSRLDLCLVHSLDWIFAQGAHEDNNEQHELESVIVHTKNAAVRD